MREHQTKHLKIGKFHVATEILRKAIHEENKELLKQLKVLFSEFIITDARCNFLQGTIEYTAYHPKFRPIPKGNKIPTYIIGLKEIKDEQNNEHYTIVNIDMWEENLWRWMKKEKEDLKATLLKEFQ